MDDKMQALVDKMWHRLEVWGREIERRDLPVSLERANVALQDVVYEIEAASVNQPVGERRTLKRERKEDG